MKVINCKSVSVLFKLMLSSIFLHLLTACDHEVSEDIATNDMYFYVHAVADTKTDVLTVTVNVRDSDRLFADHIKLTTKEKIQAVFNGESKILVYSTGFFDPLIGRFKYRARFNAGVSTGTNRLTVNLNRADGSVISTNVTIPNKFVMTYPINNAGYYFGTNDSISTAWEVGMSPENDRVSYIYTCRYENSNESYASLISSYFFPVPGTHVFNVENILSRISDEAYAADNTTCNVTVMVRNLLYDQSVNASFGGGKTRSTMQNSRDVKVMPAP